MFEGISEGLLAEDLYIVAIAALLPLTAGMVVTQVNPYYALIMRGILGAVAALVYALFGAADVALTEALVGTMLSITLYAIAVRSSMSMRLGVVKGELEQVLIPEPAAPVEDLQELEELDAIDALDAIAPATNSDDPLKHPPEPTQAKQLLDALRQLLRKHHLRLNLVFYPDRSALKSALAAKEVHSICVRVANPASSPDQTPTYQLQTHVPRLYELMQSGSLPSAVDLTLFEPVNPKLSESQLVQVQPPNAVEVQS
ncbi:MAG: DUF4040 domain-containing protein [Thainema sp.]